VRREQLNLGNRSVSYLVATSGDSDQAPKPPGVRQYPYSTVLFLHAFPLNAGMWQSQLETTPPGWRMLAPDYRGFGQSSPSQANATTMNDLAGDAIDLLDRLEVSEAVVVGCSMGGYVAFEMLASAPNYLKGLMLVDTRATPDTPEGRTARQAMLEAVDREGSEAVAREMTPKLLGETSKRERPDLVAHVHHVISATNPAAIKMAIRAMMERKDMTPSLASIHAPTVVVAGGEDSLIPATAIQQMHGGINAAKLETIDRAGHLPNLEQPDRFNAVLHRFLGQF
jgi:pimeloyl-ACP methyl ester carboxylesterase